ncbi:hypothetical protein GCM10023237_43480 [Streptomyces coeruleoprunus]
MPLAQSFCRLIGASVYPWLPAVPVASTDAPATPRATNAVAIFFRMLSLREDVGEFLDPCCTRAVVPVAV